MGVAAGGTDCVLFRLREQAKRLRNTTPSPIQIRRCWNMKEPPLNISQFDGRSDWDKQRRSHFTSGHPVRQIGKQWLRAF